MHIAMHDALNAVEPRFARWAPASPDEAAPHGASAPVAMAAAAYQVLLARHQENAAEEADALFRAAVAAEPPGPAVDAGIRLGAAIGLAAVARHSAPTSLPRPFPEGAERGTVEAGAPVPAKRLGGERHAIPVRDGRRNCAGRRHLLWGAHATSPRPRRSADWALSGRPSAPHRRLRRPISGRIRARREIHPLAASLLQERPPPGGIWAQARLMSQLAVALADSYVAAWDEKRHWGSVAAGDRPDPRQRGRVCRSGLGAAVRHAAAPGLPLRSRRGLRNGRPGAGGHVLETCSAWCRIPRTISRGR
jgi:hypothetical protein